jgi:hypothetical protein
MSQTSQQLPTCRLGFRTRFARETLIALPRILQGSNGLGKLIGLPVRLMVFRMPLTVRLLRIVAVLQAALCSPAFAQQLDYVPEVNDMSTIPIGPTSPLGIDSSSSVGGSGIPLGATEIPSAGVSPLATYSTGTIALPGSGTTCTTLGTSQTGLTAPNYTYDGGGMAMGSAATATAATAGTTMTSTAATPGSAQTAGVSVPVAAPTDPGTLPSSGIPTTYAMGTVGVSGMCSPGSSGLSPSAPTSTTPTTPGGSPRTGIPLGSAEIANLGVSSWATLPTLSASPFATTTTGTTLPTVPTMPVVTTPLSTSTTNTTASTSPTGLLLNVSGVPANVSGIPVLVPGLASRH